MEIKNVSLIGLGALGILFADLMTKKWPVENVRIVADEERIARYQKEGVYCNGKRCDFHYVTPEEKVAPADLLLFTVKFTGLADAIEAVKHHVGEETIILSAINGITSEEIIGNAYGEEKVLYCVAQGMDAVKEGNHLTYKNTGMLCFGDKQKGIISEKAKRVARFFEAIDFPHEVDDDMLKRLWGKFMLNVGVNQTVAVFRGNYGLIQREGEARQMMIGAMREVIALAQKEGIDLTEEDLHYWLSVLARLHPEGKPSMAQDVEAKRYSEVELFSGTVLKLAKKHRLNTPMNEQLYRRIKAIEAEYD